MQQSTQSPIVQPNEIFRHLRPQWFDAKTFTIVPQKDGGISFMLLPKAEGVYSYWVYICPMDAPFSPKGAVQNLRDRAKRGVEPWGEIVMNDDPVIIQLLKSVMSEENLASEVSKMAFEIMMTVWAAEARKEKAKSDPKAISIYKGL
jgi:molybdopterin-guanine dinucleotide biosynthesis protein A